jgi:predicted deacylase
VDGAAVALGTSKETERVVGHVVGTAPGPTLVCIASVHGNEPAGARALHNVFRNLASTAAGLRGVFLGLAGNLAALARRSGCSASSSAPRPRPAATCT